MFFYLKEKFCALALEVELSLGFQKFSINSLFSSPPLWGTAISSFPVLRNCFWRPSHWLAEPNISRSWQRAEPGFSHSRRHLLRLLLLPGLSEEHPSYSCCHLPVECHSLCSLILTSVTIGFRGSFMCPNSSVIPISCPIEPPLLQTMSCGLSRHSWHTVSGKGLPAGGGEWF